jgi:periplasmic protein TonB
MTTLQTVRPLRASRRLSPTSLAIVAALHVVLIYGIYEGLKNNWVPPKVAGPIVDVFVPPQKAAADNPKLVDVVLARPTGPVVKKPDFPPPNDSDGGGIQTIIGPTGGGGGIVDLPPVEVGAQGILSTHTIPTYPPIAVRLNQTGNVKLHLTIDEQGVVTAASVEKSSGYDSLDNAAVAWVIAHWRYRPATKDGTPVASSTDALVTFRLTGG